MQILSEQFIWIRPVVIKRFSQNLLIWFLFFGCNFDNELLNRGALCRATHQAISQNLLISEICLFKNCIFKFRKFWTEYLGGIDRTCFVLFASRMKPSCLNFHCLMFLQGLLTTD